MSLEFIQHQLITLLLGQMLLKKKRDTAKNYGNAVEGQLRVTATTHK
jgi:hypothetical protein